MHATEHGFKPLVYVTFEKFQLKMTTALENAIGSFSLHVTGNYVDFMLDSENTCLELNSTEVVSTVKKRVVIRACPVMVLADHDHQQEHDSYCRVTL